MIVQAKTKEQALEKMIEALASLEGRHIALIRRDCNTRDEIIILRNQWISLRDAFTFERLPNSAKMAQVRIDQLADLLCGRQTWGN